MSVTFADAIMALGLRSSYSCDDGKIVEWDIGVKTGEEQPSEEQIAAKLADLIAAYPLQELREKRNQKLTETDWIGLSDTALTNEKAAEWKLYRQKLRNLPDGLDTDVKVNAVTWPTKPE